MQNKKLSAIFIISFFIVSFGLLYFFIIGQMNNELEKKEVAVNKEETSCKYASDDEAYIEATKKPDVIVCNCVKNEDKFNSCKEMTLNNEFYVQAIAQYDPTICENISIEEIRSSCLTATSEAVSYMKKNDPLRLANIYKNYHNEKAIEEFEKIISSDSKNIENFLGLAMAYAEKGLNEQMQGESREQYLNKAFDMLNNAREINPASSELYRVEAYIYEIKPDLDKALETYNKSIQLDVNNIMAYVGRAHVNQMRGALQSSLDDLNKAVELDKNKEEIVIYSRLCNLESSRSDLIEDAKKHCEAVIETEIADASAKSLAYQVMGDIYLDEKKSNEALSYFLKAKALTPNDASIYISMAELNLTQANYAEAENQVKKSLEVLPNKASSYLALSKSLIFQKKYDEVIAATNKGLELVDADVSLLEPNKAALRRDLYYIISATYNELGDKVNEMKFEEMGNNAMKIN